MLPLDKTVVLCQKQEFKIRFLLNTHGTIKMDSSNLLNIKFILSFGRIRLPQTLTYRDRAYKRYSFPQGFETCGGTFHYNITCIQRFMKCMWFYNAACFLSISFMIWGCYTYTSDFCCKFYSPLSLPYLMSSSNIYRSTIILISLHYFYLYSKILNARGFEVLMLFKQIHT